jgi:hypothetical protein
MNDHLLQIAVHPAKQLVCLLSMCRVTTLSWSPDGRFLAAASPDTAGVTLLSVASGETSKVKVVQSMAGRGLHET